MKQLTTLDATFLHVESFRSPMHIGGVYIFENANPNEGLNYESFRDYMRTRIEGYPIFQQRLVEVPLDLGHPYWFDDPSFDIEHHLLHVALPKPGTVKQLLKLAAQIFSRPLDRQRPLWEVTIVEGLKMDGVPEGSFAMIPKIHHAAIDGKSGVALMVALFDTMPTIQTTPFVNKRKKPERIPTKVELLARHTGDALNTPFKLAKLASKTIENALKSNKKKKEIKSGKVPPAPFTAPKTMFNVEVTPHRIVDATIVSLERVKNIKNTTGTTINDVILTICSGALRSYLSEKEALPKKSLIAMAPISVRTKREDGSLGNKISAMLIALATDEADPIQRLKNINESSSGSKVIRKAVKAEKLMDYIPAQVAANAARLYTRMKIAKLHNPIYNLVITNVPGPSTPLYMNGHKLVKNFAVAPLIDGMGLMITVFSYDGTISIGVTSCREIMPDIDVFIKKIDIALDELEVAVLGKKASVAKTKTATKSKKRKTRTKPKVTVKAKVKSKTAAKAKTPPEKVQAAKKTNPMQEIKGPKK